MSDIVNYKNTTTPGTVQRRANLISLSNVDNQAKSVTFVIEDKVIMADGSVRYTPVTEMTQLMDSNFLSTLIPTYDTETGEKISEIYAGQIVAEVESRMTDLFVFLSTNRDVSEAETAAQGDESRINDVSEPLP